MMATLLNFMVALMLWTILSEQVVAESSKISIKMPDIRPDHKEQYLCKAFRLPVDNVGQYIVGFNPQGDASRVHHMLMYGCQMPGILQRDSPNFVWDCGEMHSESGENEIKSFEEAPVCRGNQQILYGWALDAPALKLPDEVGFKVGGLDTSIHFLVLQVHYGHYHVFQKQPDLTDNSGLTLDMKTNDQDSGITKQAGVLLLISLGQVLKGKSQHEIWCDIKDDITIHPFRYRVHTHKLGTQVLGAKMTHGIKSSEIGSDNEPSKDEIIGVGDPQKPQMFYPVEDTNMTLTRGDMVYARCDFENNRGHIVKIGQTGDDEMCNFYMMYWTDSPRVLSKANCFGENPRGFHFPSLW